MVEPQSRLSAVPSKHRSLIELSHPIEPGMQTVPGLPGPTVTPYLSRADSRAHYAPGTEFTIDQVTMVGNTGTYLDTPFHRYATGHDLAALPLEKVALLPAVVVRAAGSARRGIDVGDLSAFTVNGKAVLLHTGDDRAFGTSAYAENAHFLTAGAAEWLAVRGATLVGIDSVNIDDLDDPTRPAHTILLDAQIPVVEHLTGLDLLPTHGSWFTAAPPLFAHVGTLPVRAFAVVPD